MAQSMAMDDSNPLEIRLVLLGRMSQRAGFNEFAVEQDLRCRGLDCLHAAPTKASTPRLRVRMGQFWAAGALGEGVYPTEWGCIGRSIVLIR